MSSLRPSQTPNKEQSFPQISTAQLAMYVGLASLTVFFGASLVAYFITRAQAESWRSTELPHLPYGLWFSTVVLVALSWAIRKAERELLKNAYQRFERWLWSTLALSVFFLLVQVQNWRVVAEVSLGVSAKNLYSYTFYMLTALHALHVVGGIGPLTFLLRRARQGEYSSSRSEGVRLMRQYWDFLLVVWVVLLSALWFF